jgi:hypothetical protein
MSNDVEAPDPLSSAIGEFRKELLDWIETELVRLRERAQTDEETTRPPGALPERQIDRDPRPPLSNPRQRLDALARLLDHKLKQPQGTAEASGGGGTGRNAGAENDTP